MTSPLTVEGTYQVEFEYGYELAHEPGVKAGAANIILCDGNVSGGSGEFSIEGTYEMKQDDIVHMDLIAKLPPQDPAKKNQEMFFLRGRVGKDTLVLSRPTGDDPRLFVRARCTRVPEERATDARETARSSPRSARRSSS